MKLKSFLDYDGPEYRERMSLEDSEILLRLSMAEIQDGDRSAPEAITEFLSSNLGARIINSRLKLSRVTASPMALMWVCHKASNPGNAVMWAYSISHIAEKKGGDHVNMADLCKYFPFGFPTEKAMSECWDAQKQRSKGFLTSDNAMDEPDNWISAIMG